MPTHDDDKDDEENPPEDPERADLVDEDGNPVDTGHESFDNEDEEAAAEEEERYAHLNDHDNEELEE